MATASPDPGALPADSSAASGPGPGRAADLARVQAPQPLPLPPAGPADRQQEVDVWWGSYAGRTMLPSFLVCGLLTLAIMAWAFGMLPSHLARYVVYGLVGAVWLVQLARWGYRVAAINYRLTTHRLVADRGFFSPTVRQIELARVATVRVDAGPWERWVGVGRVQVVPENGQQAPVVLEGVREPERLAVLIEGCVKRAREHHVVGLHS